MSDEPRTIESYLERGQYFHDVGYPTDGCTGVGWLVHRLWPDAEKACWAHDYARRGIIGVASQEENDKLFREGLKRAGVPGLMRQIMYYAVRFQDRTGWSPAPLIGFTCFMIVLALLWVYG